jgi:hypothetical protein
VNNLQDMAIEIIKLLNQYSGAVQAVMVVVLAFMTIRSVIDTNRMAKVAAKQLQLQTMPVAVIGESISIIVKEGPQPGTTAPLTDFIRLQFDIKNIGQVPLKYSVTIEFQAEVKESPVKEIILFPGQSLKRWSQFDCQPIDPLAITGKGKVSMIYCALDIPEQKNFFSFDFEIESSSHYTILKNDAGRVSG